MTVINHAFKKFQTKVMTKQKEDLEQFKQSTELKIEKLTNMKYMIARLNMERDNHHHNLHPSADQVQQKSCNDYTTVISMDTVQP